ncbi:MAG: CHAD domain-containing protein [Candidatus Dormibacteria bacterium]
MTEGASRSPTPVLRQADLDELNLVTSGAGPGATTGEMMAAIVASSVLRLFEQVPLLPHGIDNEAVHQARVATRRLRSDMRTFRTLFDEGWAEVLRAELSWLADLLGQVRDADVLVDRMIATLADIDGAPTGRRVVLQALAARRAAARSHMLDGMAQPRYAALLADLVQASRSPTLSGLADEPAGEALPGFAARPWRKLHHAVGRLGENPSDDDLHAVRIAAKRARYAAEAVEPVVGPRARRYAAAVAELQGALGDYHDAVVARQWLAEITPGLRRGGAFYTKALSERELARGVAALGQWEVAWKRASRRRLRSWMSDD